MILFVEYGRLGNQIFQYTGIKKLLPRHKIVCFGCESLQAAVEGVRATFISPKSTRRPLWYRLLHRAIPLLSAGRLLGSIREDRSGQMYKVTYRRGLIPKVYVLCGVYFQHTDMVNQLDYQSLKPRGLADARAFLKAKSIDDVASKKLVFVHVRRGDYCFWPSRQYPAVLELDWYKRAMEKMRSKVGKPLFIIVTDDYHYAKDVFVESDELVVSHCDMATDLALMALCEHGILSASSFAWWGACFAKQQETNTNQCFLAPKFWAGHRRKQWVPDGFVTNWIEYTE